MPTNKIDYITMASTGDSSDFGDLTDARYYFAAVNNTTTRVKETINTDWLQEEDAVLLQGLLSSTNVAIVTSPSHPVIITDSSMVRKTVANARLKIQYTLKIEWAAPINQVDWKTNVSMIS